MKTLLILVFAVGMWAGGTVANPHFSREDVVHQRCTDHHTTQVVLLNRYHAPNPLSDMCGETNLVKPILKN
jgi:hypothetical protein